MATVDEIKIVVKAEVDSAIQKMTQLNNVNKQNSLTGLDMAKSIAGYTSAYGLAVQGAQALIRGTADLIKNSVVLAAGVERVKMEFSVLTGSMEASNKLFAQMNSLAAQTPLELSDITSAGKQLLSVGIPVDQITTKLRMLGDVAMGNPEKLERLTQAFGQLKSKGVASMEQLNRFIEAGVPIMAELQKQTGKTGDEVFKMVSQGKIGYPEVTKALEALTGEGGLMHDMMAKVATTVEGKMSTAMDNWKMRLKELGAELLPMVSKALDEFNASMDRVSATRNIEATLKGTSSGTAEISQAMADVKKYMEEIASGKSKDPYAQINLVLYKEQLKTLQGLYFVALAKESAAKQGAENESARMAKAAKDAKDYADYLERIAWYESLGSTAFYSERTQGAIEYKEALAASAKAVEVMVLPQTIGAATAFEDMGLAEYQAAVATEKLRKQYIELQNAMGGGTAEAPTLLGPAIDADMEAFDRYLAKLDETQKKQEELANVAMNGAMGIAEAFGTALVTGEEGWKAFGKAGLNAIAGVIEAFGKQYAAMAIAEFFTPGMQGVAIGHSLAAAGLFTAAGAVKAIPMAEGGSGIVTKPTLFLAGEAGPEPFAFGGANNKLGMGGGVTQIFNIGGSVIAERQVMQLGVAGMAMAGRGY